MTQFCTQFLVHQNCVITSSLILCESMNFRPNIVSSLLQYQRLQKFRIRRKQRPIESSIPCIGITWKRRNHKERRDETTASLQRSFSTLRSPMLLFQDMKQIQLWRLTTTACRRNTQLFTGHSYISQTDATIDICPLVLFSWLNCTILLSIHIYETS